MKRLEVATALLLLALAAVVTIGTFDLPYWKDFAPGPAFASFWLAGAGALLGVLLLLAGLRRSPGDPADWPDRSGAKAVLLTAVSLLAFLGLLAVAGTAISGIALMLFLLLVVARRPLLPSLLTTALTVGMIESIFGLWLNIDLPGGMIGF